MNSKMFLTSLFTLLLVHISLQQRAKWEACRVLCGGSDEGPIISSSEEDESPEYGPPIAMPMMGGRWGRPSRPRFGPPPIRSNDWRLTSANTRLIPQSSRPSPGSRWGYGYGRK